MEYDKRNVLEYGDQWDFIHWKVKKDLMLLKMNVKNSNWYWK